MPKSAENKIRRQGGIARYRSIRKGGHTITIAVTRKAGPRGGHSVGWKRN